MLGLLELVFYFFVGIMTMGSDGEKWGCLIVVLIFLLIGGIAASA